MPSCLRCSCLAELSIVRSSALVKVFRIRNTRAFDSTLKPASTLPSNLKQGRSQCFFISDSSRTAKINALAHTRLWPVILQYITLVSNTVGLCR